jgi:hypothetical protein
MSFSSHLQPIKGLFYDLKRERVDSPLLKPLPVLGIPNALRFDGVEFPALPFFVLVPHPQKKLRR